MKYSEYISINKEAISLVKKSQKELERHGWSNNRFPIVGKTLKEAEEALKLSVEDLKKKREEMGEKKFNFWLKKLEKNVSDLKGRLSAWEKIPTEEEERKKKEEDLDENVFSLRESILELSGVLEEETNKITLKESMTEYDNMDVMDLIELARFMNNTKGHLVNPQASNKTKKDFEMYLADAMKAVENIKQLSKKSGDMRS